MKKSKKILSMLLAAAMLCGLNTTSVFAEDTPTHSQGIYGSVGGKETFDSVPFTKILTAVEDAVIPTETFTFTMTPDTSVAEDGQALSSTDSTIVYRGVALSGNNGTVTVSVDDESCTNDNLETIKKTDVPALRESAEDAEVKGYVFNRSFSLTGVTFPKSGVYRYIVDESDSSNTSSLIDYDTRTYVVDLYVNTNGAVSYIVAKRDGNKSDIVFENRSEYTDIIIKKTLVDPTSMVPEDTEFSFKIKIPEDGVALNLDKDTVMNAYIRADGSDTKLTGDKVIKVGGSQTNALDDDGWQSFTLKKDEALVIKGVPVGMIYNLQETNTTGYSVKYATVFGKTALSTDDPYNDSASTGWITTNALGNYTEFVNTKNTITDTGVVLDVMPYVLIVRVAAAGILLFVFIKIRTAR
jgi:pilin isopeptide linkage protein